MRVHIPLRTMLSRPVFTGKFLDSRHRSEFSVLALRRSLSCFPVSISNSSLSRGSFYYQHAHNHPSGTSSCGHQQFRTFITAPVLQSEWVDITFVTCDGKKLKTKGKIGDNLLDVVVNNKIDLDGFGACEGTLACSTCHLVFKKTDFSKIPDKVTDEELDMLDLAYGLTDTSRLGCQVVLTKDLDGLEVEVPAGVNDQRD